MPSLFKTKLFWPNPIVKNKKRKNTEKIPTVATSEEWLQYHLKKENEKLEKQRQIEINKQKRIEAKKIKLEEAELKKRIKQEKIESKEKKLKEQQEIKHRIKQEKAEAKEKRLMLGKKNYTSVSKMKNSVEKGQHYALQTKKKNYFE